MKTLHLILDYKLPSDSSKDVRELTCQYIESLVVAKHSDKQGLEGQLRRTFGRLQRKLDEAIELKKDKVELEDAEFDLIKNSLEAKINPLFSKYINTLEEEIERVKNA